MAYGRRTLGSTAWGRTAVRGEFISIPGPLLIPLLVPTRVGGVLAPLRYRGSYTPTILKQVSIGQL